MLYLPNVSIIYSLDSGTIFTLDKNTNNNTLVYSEQCEAFTSLYDVNIKTALSFPEGIYITTDKLIDQWNKTDGTVQAFG